MDNNFLEINHAIINYKCINLKDFKTYGIKKIHS